MNLSPLLDHNEKFNILKKLSTEKSGNTLLDLTEYGPYWHPHFFMANARKKYHKNGALKLASSRGYAI